MSVFGCACCFFF